MPNKSEEIYDEINYYEVKCRSLPSPSSYTENFGNIKRKKLIDFSNFEKPYSKIKLPQESQKVEIDIHIPDNLEEESSSDEFLSEFFPDKSNKVNKIKNGKSSSNTTSTGLSIYDFMK